MNRDNFWRFTFIILFLILALIFMYPPTSQDLIETFQKRAYKADQTFLNIVKEAQTLQKEKPDQPYDNLRQAIGTNDVTRYFPYFEAKDDPHPTERVLIELEKLAAGKIHLGLDLQGGSSFLVRMDTSALTNVSDIKTALNGAVEVLRKRVDNLGVAEPVIETVGGDRILVQLPGLSRSGLERAKENIKRAARLTLHLVNPNSDQDIATDTAEPTYVILKHKEIRQGREITEKAEIKKRPEMDGSGITHAWVSRDNMGKPEILFSLNDDGAAKFAKLTREHVKERMAIVLDGELMSAPVINEPIENGSCRITGSFEDKEAFDLASALENPLRASLQIEQSQEVDPTLGKASIRSGIQACIYGTAAVAIFMLVYYMLVGMVANVALLANLIILLGAMCSIGTTLTLPGIAGIVLTVGMAVDANVLIYERIREERAKYKSLRGSIAAGYQRAFGTIFDSHVTTLISSIILWNLGTGSIKGFGVALTIGVLFSLFTSLVITRAIFDFTLDKGRTHLVLLLIEAPAFLWFFWAVALKYTYGQGFLATGLAVAGTLGMIWLVSRTLHRFLDGLIAKGALPVFPLQDVSMLHIIRAAKLNFMRWAVPAFVTSWLLIGIGVGWGLHRGKSALGVDFLGGDTTTLEIQKRPSEQQVRDALAKAGVADPTIQFQKDPTSGRETLRVVSASDTGAKVKATLESFPGAGLRVIGQDHVGPIVGEEIKRSAVIASLVSLFCILVYVAFRYEFSFAVGAVLAVIHDVLMTVGWYCLSGREFDATTVAAILTIIGFSTNDTIVIFDRIREDLKLGIPGSFREVMNKALNQTLSRTIITSGTVFLATLSLYIFGGGAINAFAFTFLVGIITGTYSSIYIASALVLWWHKGQRPRIGTGPIPVANVATVKA
ncbi:MAG: hypothetical protein C5B50_29890 [Verrucomicrobia bacterium]|nr:MAG: hypothetical protein C5B50_29890 [Verrucomicrobiota bacterium]